MNRKKQPLWARIYQPHEHTPLQLPRMNYDRVTMQTGACPMNSTPGGIPWNR